MSQWHAAYFQGIVTLGMAIACWSLYLRYRRADFLWWSVAWTMYVLRIVALLLFVATRDEPWIFLHQVLTGWIALALLWAALVCTHEEKWRRVFVVALLFPVIWSYLATWRLDSFLLAAMPAVLFLSFATLWTGWVFLRQWRATGSRGAAVLGGVLVTWGLHHLNYPFLRARNAWNPWGYYLDILFMLGTAIGILLLVLDELDRRTRELEGLSARAVTQHEDERRRISMELHDQSAQVWASVKLQLGLIRERAPVGLTASVDHVLSLVDAGMRSIRNVTTDLRPPLLDDLGLLPALRALVQSFSEETGLDISFHAPNTVPPVSQRTSLALYRALQEGLANTARHSGASAAVVSVNVSGGELLLSVADNGRGLPDRRARPQQHSTAPHPSYGLAGMRERITGLHGSMDIESTSADGTGACLTVRVPIDHAKGA